MQKNNPQPYVTLNDGNTMPQFGLGVWKAEDGDEVENAVKVAIDAGYRLIDTAAVYRNESGVGNAIAASGIAREELFITTKLWNSDQASGKVRQALMVSLERLGLDYIDLYLIHWPMPDVNKAVDAWNEMQKLQKEGLIRSIGVSNFRTDDLEELREHTAVVPAVNQIELHPYFPQTELQSYGKSHGIHTQSWSPLGGSKGDLLSEPVLKEIGDHYAKSPAQVVLRWHIQNDLVVIPKSVNDNRIKQNIDIFDFELSADDMRRISLLENGQRSGADPATMNLH